jgi:hypothetical protein
VTVALADGLREYMARDWAAVRESKEAALAERLDRLGPAESLRMADELRQFARSVGSDPAAPDLRAADLEAHERLSALLRRASHV